VARLCGEGSWHNRAAWRWLHTDPRASRRRSVGRGDQASRNCSGRRSKMETLRRIRRWPAAGPRRRSGPRVSRAAARHTRARHARKCRGWWRDGSAPGVRLARKTAPDAHPRCRRRAGWHSAARFRVPAGSPRPAPVPFPTAHRAFGCDALRSGSQSHCGKACATRRTRSPSTATPRLKFAAHSTGTCLAACSSAVSCAASRPVVPDTRATPRCRHSARIRSKPGGRLKSTATSNAGS
jgi:hypothetical protein